MATIYRWRKSTVGTVSSQSTAQFYDVEILETSIGSTGTRRFYSSETYIFNSGGTVSLQNPISRTFNRNNVVRIPGTEYLSNAISSDTLYKNNSQSNEIIVSDINGVMARVSSSNNGSIVKYYNFRQGAGTFIEYVYSTSSSTYPNGGVSGNYYYDQRTTITINITVPSIVMSGQDIPISWNTVSGSTEYFLERQADGGSWTQVYNGSTNSYTDTAGAWSNVKYRLRMTISGTMTPYVESSTCQVLSASTLAISGTDGDLGTLTNDVEYTVISTGTSAITVTEAVDGVYTKTFTATAGAANKISVLDLLTGTGSIRITASTNPGSGVIEVERSWTYSKTAAAFSAYGNTAELKRNGVPVWPLTLAECVRLPGGETLDVGMLRVEIGWYQGTNTYGASNPTSISFSGKPYLVFITSGAFNSLINPLVRISNSNATSAATFAASSSSIQSISATWGDNSVSWYSTSSAQGQLNGTGGYHYLALLLVGDE